MEVLTNSLYDKRLHCPNCEMEFTGKKPLSSKIRVDRIDSDYRKVYRGVNPYLYEVNVCPYCGFAFGENINTSIPEAYLPKLREFFLNIQNFSNLCRERTIPEGIRAYLIAIYIAEQINQSHIRIGYLYLRIAWLYRELEDVIQEHNYMEKALRNFEYGYEYEDFERLGIKQDQVLYQMTELCRRLDFFESAKKWYALFFSLRSASRQLLHKARDHWMEYKSSKVQTENATI